MNLNNRFSGAVQTPNKSDHAEEFWGTTAHSRGSFVSTSEFIVPRHNCFSMTKKLLRYPIGDSFGFAVHGCIETMGRLNYVYVN